MASELSKPDLIGVDRRLPTILGILASAALTALVIIGSRSLEHFDSALFGYTIASIVAFDRAAWHQAKRARTGKAVFL